MKLIDADELIRTIQKDCKENKNPSLWVLLGFIVGYINKAPDLSAKILQENK